MDVGERFSANRGGRQPNHHRYADKFKTSLSSEIGLSSGFFNFSLLFCHFHHTAFVPFAEVEAIVEKGGRAVRFARSASSGRPTPDAQYYRRMLGPPAAASWNTGGKRFQCAY
jgi:hypothetical protein